TGMLFQDSASFTPYELAAFHPEKEGFGAITVDLSPKTEAAAGATRGSAEGRPRIYERFGANARHAQPRVYSRVDSPAHREGRLGVQPNRHGHAELCRGPDRRTDPVGDSLHQESEVDLPPKGGSHGHSLWLPPSGGRTRTGSGAHHPSRSATSGSMRVARRAGIRHAATATSVRMALIPTKVTGSLGVIPTSAR